MRTAHLCLGLLTLLAACEAGDGNDGPVDTLDVGADKADGLQRTLVVGPTKDLEVRKTYQLACPSGTGGSTASATCDIALGWHIDASALMPFARCLEFYYGDKSVWTFSTGQEGFTIHAYEIEEDGGYGYLPPYQVWAPLVISRGWDEQRQAFGLRTSDINLAFPVHLDGKGPVRAEFAFVSNDVYWMARGQDGQAFPTTPYITTTVTAHVVH